MGYVAVGVRLGEIKSNLTRLSCREQLNCVKRLAIRRIGMLQAKKVKEIASAGDLSKASTMHDDLMRWQVGERVVYPSHGVGKIVSIESNELFGPGVEVYVLELMQSPRRVLIPTTKAEKGALRPIVSVAESNRIIASLKEPPAPSKSVPWTKRQRILLDKLSSSCLQDVADVLRELFHLKSVKDLSFGQRRLFDTAIALLVQELSISLQREPDELEVEIRAMFAEPEA